MITIHSPTQASADMVTFLTLLIAFHQHCDDDDGDGNS